MFYPVFSGKDVLFSRICSVLEGRRQSFYLKLWFIQKGAINLILQVFTEYFLWPEDRARGCPAVPLRRPGHGSPGELLFTWVWGRVQRICPRKKFHGGAVCGPTLSSTTVSAPNEFAGALERHSNTFKLEIKTTNNTGPNSRGPQGHTGAGRCQGPAGGSEDYGGQRS